MRLAMALRLAAMRNREYESALRRDLSRVIYKRGGALVDVISREIAAILFPHG